MNDARKCPYLPTTDTTMFHRVMMIQTVRAPVCLIGMLFFISGCGPAENQATFDQKIGSVESTPVEGAAGQVDSGAMTLVSETGDKGKLRRRIVYDSHLTLVVVQYEDFESSIDRLVEKHDGFISNSETDRRYEDRQSGTWVARIPVENYSDFLAAITELGFSESRTENAKDITAEYVDVQARIRNNQQLEQRILEMLEERAGKLSDVLEIERELARVRDEIERMQGRMRVLTDQSSLATITIDVREEQEYIPPSAPTLSSRLGSTWSGSLESLRRAGVGVLLILVASTPWLVTLAIFALLIFGIVRLARRRRVS